MLIIPPPHHRRRGKLLNEETPPTPPPGPLVLLSATVIDFEGSDVIVKLVFDTTEANPIANIGSAVGTNWTATIEGYAFGGNTPLELSAYNIVLLQMGNQSEAVGSNVISYTASPADIVDASGRSLAAFSHLPLDM